MPFKLVFETVSYEDSVLITKAKPPETQQNSEEFKKKAPLILPQSYFGEEWGEISSKIKEVSLYRKYPSYCIKCFMVWTV